MPVHAATGADGPDLLTTLRVAHPYVGLIHRLDREASGLLIVTLRPEANQPLQRQLETHAIVREYLAIVHGVMRADERRVDRPISPRSQGRSALRRKPGPDAQAAVSHFRVVRRLADTTLVEVRLETGRKHQIRVHAAAIGHPLLGDRRYGGPPAPRLCLHATRLRFAHPDDARAITVESPLPPELAA